MIADTGPTTVYIGRHTSYTIIQYTTDSTDTTGTSTGDTFSVCHTTTHEEYKSEGYKEWFPWEEKLEWLNSISTLSILHTLKQKTPPLKQWFYKVIRQPKPKSTLKARLYK